MEAHCYYLDAMRLDIRPFEPKQHLEPAAALLADRHRADRSREPLLPPSFEDSEACRTQIEHTLESRDWRGVAAYDGSRFAGYAIMTPQLFPPTHFLAGFFPSRGASISYQGYAALPGLEFDAYRAMYASLADYFVAQGFFDHSVSLPAADTDSAEAWTSLGFGRTMTCAIRGVEPPERVSATNIAVHQASTEDAEVIFALNYDLMLHHARAPIFQPLLHDSDESSHEFSRGLLADPANAHWVGYEDGRAVAMNTFMRPLFMTQMVCPEKTVYLFQGIVAENSRSGGVGTALLSQSAAWAREQGYEHIALHFASPNIEGARFWQSSRFKPVEHTLRRHIDERVAWADA